MDFPFSHAKQSKCRISYSAFSSPHSQISAIALKLLPVFTRGKLIVRGKVKAFDESRNRPQALTCFHTAAVFNAENLCLFKPQNTNLPHSEAC